MWFPTCCENDVLPEIIGEPLNRFERGLAKAAHGAISGRRTHEAGRRGELPQKEPCSIRATKRGYNSEEERVG